MLARQPGLVRGPRLDRQAATGRTGRRSRSSTSIPARRRRGTRRSRSPGSTGPRSSISALRAYPKVTGKRGIQAWLPIEPKYEFHDTSDWVEELSRAIGAMVPNLVSWEWAKAARKGRARLDYTQNTFIKTLVAPYSVRPAAGRAGVGADRLGRARRPDAAAELVHDPERSSSASPSGRRPVRRRADRPAGAAEARLTATARGQRGSAPGPRVGLRVAVREVAEERLAGRLARGPSGGGPGRGGSSTVTSSRSGQFGS